MTREEKERLDRIEKKLDELLARPPVIAPQPLPMPQPWRPPYPYPPYPQRPRISYHDIGF